MTPTEIARRAAAEHFAERPAAELLANYAARRDPQAFAGLVHQFGPLVLGTCRRVLGPSADADDAFQVVFLALARRAGSFRDGRAVPAWLHRVALRVARKLLSRRPSAAPLTADPADPADPFAGVAWKDLRRVLDEELDRLPGKFRGPLILCWLDGLTQDEAAALLGVSLNTVKRRLDAARELLRNRLLTRGVAPVVIAAAVADPAGLRAVVPEPLVVAAVELALPGATLPPPTVALVREAAGSGRNLVKAGVLIGLLAGTVAAGLFFATVNRQGVPPPPPEVAKAEEPLEPPPEVPERFDALGDPLPAAARFRLGTDRYRVDPPVTGAAVSPDGKQIAVAASYGLSLFDLDTGRVLWHRPNYGVGLTGHGIGKNEMGYRTAVDSGNRHTAGIAFAADGSRVFALSAEPGPDGAKTGMAVQVLDAGTGRLLKRYVRPSDPAHQDTPYQPKLAPGFTDLWFPPGARYLYVRAGLELHTLDPGTGEVVRSVPTAGWVKAVAPDGQFYAEVKPAKSSPTPQTPPVLNPDGKADFGADWKLAQFDPAGNEIRRYPIGRDGSNRVQLIHSPDGTRLLSGWGVWDTTTGEQVHQEHTAPLANSGFANSNLEKNVTFTPDGRSLRSPRGTFELATGKATRYEYREPERDVNTIGNGVDGHADLPNSLLGSNIPFDNLFFPLPGGTTAVAVNTMGVISRWEFGTGVMNRVGDPGDTNKLVSIRSADGRVIAAVQKDLGRIDLADGATGQPLRTIRTGYLVYSQAISPDGSVLATIDQLGVFILWDTATGQKRTIAQKNPMDHAGLGGVAFSPDGSVVVASTLELGTAAFEVSSGKKLWAHPVIPYPWNKLPPAGSRLVEWPTFSPDGQVLLCGDFHHFPHEPIFRDARTGDPLARYEDGVFRKGDPVGYGGRLKGKPFPVFSPGGGLIGQAEWQKDIPRRVVRVQHSGGQSEFRLLPATTKMGQERQNWEILPFAFGPNGVWAATSDDKDVVIWDVGTETPVRRLRGHRGAVYHLDWGHDARTLISSARDRTSLVWEVKPDLPAAEARTPEQLWDDLGGDPVTAFRAVWLAADHLQKKGVAEHFKKMIDRGPRPDPERSAAEYWRHQRAVLAVQLMADPDAEKWLKALAGSKSGVAAEPGSPPRGDETEDKAVAFVTKLGGTVTRDEKAPGKPVVAVSLRGTKLTDAGLKELAPLKNLTSLDLSGTKVTEIGPEALAPFKSLTTLDLARTEVTKEGLEELGALTNLTSLDLGGCRKVGDEGLLRLAPLKKLTTLNLSGTRVRFDWQSLKFPLENLTSLDLSHTDVWNVQQLVPLKSLTTLNLSHTLISGDGLKELAPFKSLTTLKLDATWLTDDDLKALREIGLLHALSLASAADGRRPTKPDDVIGLDLSKTMVTGGGLKELAPFKNLTTLDLSGTGVKDTGLKELAPFKNLTTLSLPQLVTDAGLKELAVFKNLTSLNLLHTEATANGVKELQKALPKCKVYHR